MEAGIARYVWPMTELPAQNPDAAMNVITAIPSNNRSPVTGK
jgi:hypothetical protein